MKKAVSLLLIFVMVIIFNGCGASGQDTAGAVDAQSDSGEKTEAAGAVDAQNDSGEKTEAESESAQGAAEWDASEEKFFDYDNGQVLLENENIRISASSLINYMSEKGMMMSVNLKMENISDSSIKVRAYKKGNKSQSWVDNIGPGESDERGIVPIYDWNGKVDAGEESYLGQYLIRATNEKEDIAAVFDLYASETTPFANIITDIEQIASVWGELKDPLGTPSESGTPGESGASGESGDKDSGKDSVSNETTKEESPKVSNSEEVTIIAALEMNENNLKIWSSVQEAVARDGIRLQFAYQDGSEGLIDTFEQWVPNMCIGMSKAFFTEVPKYFSKSDETDEIALRYAEFLDTACPVGYMNFTPINLCSEKISSVDELAEGSVITVPRDFDFMNMSYLIRSLDLLEKAGLITLKNQSELTDEEPYGLNRFIKENPKGITLNRLSVEEIMNDTSAYDAFILPGETNGNILFEDPHQSDPDYWEQIWVKKEMVSDPAMLDAIEKIVEAYQSEANLEYVENPVGWDVDLIGQYR